MFLLVQMYVWSWSLSVLTMQKCAVQLLEQASETNTHDCFTRTQIHMLPPHIHKHVEASETNKHTHTHAHLLHMYTNTLNSSTTVCNGRKICDCSSSSQPSVQVFARVFVQNVSDKDGPFQVPSFQNPSGENWFLQVPSLQCPVVGDECMIARKEGGAV